jgi:signal peptidase I
MRSGIAVVGLTCLAVMGCGTTAAKTATKTVTVAASGAAAGSTLNPGPERFYRVPAASMEPTLSVGAHVVTQPLTGTPQVGDIVVFHPPKDFAQEVCGPTPHVVRLGGAACTEPEPEPAEIKLIKRIVAGPGDVMSIVDGHVIRNGTREQDSYIKPCGSSPECNFPTPIKIASGKWFLLGDNRGESDDSRFWGPIPTGWIIGVAHACSAVGIACVETR